ncbi:UNVERIFIED_CONTAM: putative mitochondrial protein [Sesamum radiatum]|uniref:Mitochondrial protein n=1 Tax=Sesamum radiatum TaxID=300843 RepID=A0AAW2Q0C3_SESRA
MFGIDVEARGKSGGLMLLWSKSIVVHVRSYSVNHIDAEIHGQGGMEKWRLTGFYGEPDASKRKAVWQRLVQLSQGMHLPWLCVGDFNKVLHQTEKTGIPRPGWQIRDFREALDQSNLSDLGYRGHRYSWWNRRLSPHTVHARLDWACGNLELQSKFPLARVSHLQMIHSDHCPILVDFQPSELANGRRDRKRFRFEADIKDTEDRIAQKQQGLFDTATSRGLQVLKGQLEELRSKEEIMWQQRSKAHWLWERDRNTKFFHSTATTRKKYNAIARLKDDRGTWREDRDGLEEVLLGYFRNIFSCSNPSASVLEDALNTINRKVMAEMNESLIQPFTAQEHIVGTDVTSSVLNILNSGSILHKMNFTHIVLIAKRDDPETVAHFRPISLCNTIVKLASKCVANRLKPLLDVIISPTQLACIPNRLIMDNVLVAFELNHFVKNRICGKDGYFALKLDMSKAYDRVEWNFLRAVLSKIGIHEIFGDPLSPYLFLFVEEVFSSMLQEAERRGEINGIDVSRQSPRISHLLFADDTIIFGKARDEALESIKRVLEVYERASGQQINLEKSSMVVSRNVSDVERARLARILGVQLVAKHDKYLGLPAIAGRSPAELFQSVKDRVWSRIQGWNAKLLSQGERGVLIKAVLQAIPTYVMSCFQLPDYLLHEIQRMIGDFWWHNKGERRTHWVSWKRMCLPREEGGMGFRELKMFNTAMLAKQGWRILKRPDSMLTRVLKGKYFSSQCFLDAQLGTRPSLTWRSYIGARELLLSGCRWKIGSGTSIRIWRDNWLSRSTGFTVTSPPRILDPDTRVSALIDANNGNWKTELVLQVFDEEEANLIVGIPLSHVHGPDILVWHDSKNGVFSVNSAYHLAFLRERQHRSSTSVTHMHVNGEGMAAAWRFIWRSQVPPKVRTFVWRACHEAVPTALNLARMVPEVDTQCMICGVANESLQHVLLHCSFTRQVWALSNLQCRIIGMTHDSVHQ